MNEIFCLIFLLILLWHRLEVTDNNTLNYLLNLPDDQTQNNTKNIFSDYIICKII